MNISRRIIGPFLYHAMRTLACLPRAFHYACADLLAFFLHRVLKYRRAVVQNNLAHSFPEKGEQERAKIEKAFYRHLADLFVEVIMYTRFTAADMERYAPLKNTELLQELHEQGHRTVFILMGHTANWEWYSGAQVFMPFTKLYELYKPMGGAFEYVMTRIREHLGSVCVDKNVAPIEIVRLVRSKHPFSVVFIADQTPSWANCHVFTDFLNQETAVHSGAERLARRLKVPMILVQTCKRGRGVYEAEMQLLSLAPHEEEWGTVSARFMKGIEACIKEQPEVWLWSHRRWKISLKEAQKNLGAENVVYKKS